MSKIDEILATLENPRWSNTEKTAICFDCCEGHFVAKESPHAYDEHLNIVFADALEGKYGAISEYKPEEFVHNYFKTDPAKADDPFHQKLVGALNLLRTNFGTIETKLLEQTTAFGRSFYILSHMPIDSKDADVQALAATYNMTSKQLLTRVKAISSAVLRSDAVWRQTWTEVSATSNDADLNKVVVAANQRYAELANFINGILS